MTLFVFGNILVLSQMQPETNRATNNLLICLKRLATVQGVLRFLMGGEIVEYMSIADAAVKWNITKRRIQVLCIQQRIPGVCKIGNIWAIPKDAQKPADARIKSGHYQKKHLNDE